MALRLGNGYRQLVILCSIENALVSERPLSPAPRNEAEFQNLMRAVDSALSEQGVSLSFRSLAALREVAIRTGEAQQMPTPDRPPRTGVYSGADLTIRVRNWFEERYGDALLMDFSLGTTAVLLRGATWPMKVPFMAGTFQLLSDPSTPSDVVAPGPDTGPPARFNVLDTIENLTPALRKSLNPREQSYVLQIAQLGLEGYKRICDAFRLPLVSEARTDYAAAAQHLVGQYAHPGQAKWASLQAAEKMLKCFITARSQTPPRTHDLAALADLAESLGLPQWTRPSIAVVQVSPGARYGDPVVTLDEAVTAHHGAITVGGIVAGVLLGHPFPLALVRVAA